MEYRASQCLSYALGKWKEEGGYLLLGRSVHWCIPHVLHMTNDGVISHYVPDKLLKAPWYSIFGFKGKVIEQDTTERGPMNMLCMLIGTLLLLVLGGLWSLTVLKDKLMLKLVDNAKQSWRWFSMQAMTLAGALQGTWLSVPQDLKDNVPTNMVHWITLGLVFAGIVGRLVKQDAT